MLLPESMATAHLQADSGMALASISKTFTAAEVMLLAERGRLDLDPAAAFSRDLWTPLGSTRVAYQDQQTLGSPSGSPRRRRGPGHRSPCR